MQGWDLYNRTYDAAADRAGDTANALGDMNAQMQNRRAGSMIAGGDYAGGANALLNAGDLTRGMAVQSHQRDTAAADLKLQTEQQTRQQHALVAGAQGLRYLPPDQRWQAFQTRVLPILQQEGIGPDVLGQISQDHMGDADLDSVIAMSGGEVQRGTPINAGNGRIVRPDPYTGQIEELSAAQDPTAPAGYRWTADHNLELIPGGPADPRVRGTQAAATRAPRRGGGGGGSGGSSRPASSAAPAGRPWERSW